MTRKGKVLVAMSGGVDSSTAALLLQREGYECVGATMQLYDSIRIDCKQPTCCSVDDIEDARRVAERIGMPYHVIDFRDEFEDRVIMRFMKEYAAGRTPNPCIDCNNRMKFGLLLRAALDMGCDYLATGHYARVVRDETDAAHLLRGLDVNKDQSYVLAGISQESLQHVLLPLGDYTKQQVRELAEQAGFSNAEKPESQDICFVPDGDYVGFLERYMGRPEAKGEIVDTKGNVLGKHKGLSAYTIGQRQGLGVAAGHPLYVCVKDAMMNRLVVGEREDLARTEVETFDFNWIQEPLDGHSFRAEAKIRYRAAQKPCFVHVGSDQSRPTIVFVEPEYGVAPGQAMVVYNGDEVLGGGTIATACK